MYESILRPLLFKVDPETVHEMAMSLIGKGLVSAPRFEDDRLRQTLFGVKFPNPLGLAAGFDKNAHAVSFWSDLGFGFAEIGTVTRHPQPGNPKPRIFRHPDCQGLVNRLGFNNDGAVAIASRLSEFESTIPIGVNLGKSKVTPLDQAEDDYVHSYGLLRDHGDYFVINVSSPNTPGLRQLQDKRALAGIIRGVGTAKPLFVKIAPDLEEPALLEVLEVAVDMKLTGVIATNTTINHSFEKGGLSGKPVQERSNQVLKTLASVAPPGLILIGVGGIFDADDLWEKIACGAHLCQIYTGWVYGGPATIPRILEKFCERMDREGVNSLDQIRGTSR